MTTIFTRVFANPSEAHRVADRLVFKGVPKAACDVIVASDAAKADMARAMVHEGSISTYEKRLAAGNAVLVVRATYKPLGAAAIVRDYLDALDTVATAKAVEEYKAAWEPDRAPSILKDHPHFLSFPGLEPRGGLSSMFGIPTLKSGRRRQNLMSHDKRMSRMFWPMKLVSEKKRSSSVIHGGRHMSTIFWPMKLISSGERRNSVIPGGGFPFSRRFGMKTIS